MFKNLDKPLDQRSFLIDALALLGISLYCLFASLFGPDFAKLNFRLPSLDFPIFISEQLLAGLIILWLIKKQRTKTLRWSWVLLVFIGWILWEAIIGYIEWGPLSLRNAALFYYILFFYCGLSFYNLQVLLHRYIFAGLVALIAFFILSNTYVGYYWFSYCVLLIVLLTHLKAKIIPLLATTIILVFYSLHLFNDSRSHLIGILVALIFIVWALLYNTKRSIKPAVYWGIIILFLLLLFMGYQKFSDKNSIKSMVTPSEVIRLYKEYKSAINAQQASYTSYPIKLRLFCEQREKSFNAQKVSEWVSLVKDQILNKKVNPSDESTVKPSQIKMLSESTKTHREQSNAFKLNDKTNVQDFNSVPKPIESESSQKTQSETVVNTTRSLDGAYTNILFRWFIWEDMWNELIETKSWFGVGFGKPQRSRSIEILSWAPTEWGRDGWITPHNSYLHIIYRAGLIGVCIVFWILYTFIRLVKTFIYFKSIKGILCLSVLLYWMVMANFLLIFEFPYTAIFFWSLFGLTFAYAKDLKRRYSEDVQKI